MPTPVWTLLGKAAPAGSATTIPVTLTRAQDAGTIIVVDASIAASAGTASATCSDNRSVGNSYHLDNVGNNGNRPIAVFSSKPGTLLQSGDVVTVAGLVSGASRGALVWQVTNLDQTTWLVNATGAGASGTTPDSGSISLVAGDYALHGTLASSNAATATVSDNGQGGTYTAGDTAGNVACEQMQATPVSTLLYKAKMSQGSTAYYMGLTVYKVAAGGTIINKTPSGGIVLGGSATQARTIAKTPSGGIVLGGSASKTRTVAASPSGGIVLGGSASKTRTIAKTPSGGLVLGGSATQSRTVAKTPSGGIVLGGTASKSLSVSPTGGIVLGGTATQARTVARATSGGIVLGGTASYTRAVARTVSGGIVLGGSATTTRTIARSTTGGIVLGGTAAATTDNVITSTPTGGLVLGGSATKTRTVARTTTGGVVLGGTATQSRTIARTASGGIVLGGTASYTAGQFYSTSGGIVLGGSSTHTATRSVLVVGGIVLGGTCTVTVIRPQPSTVAHGGGGFPQDWFERMVNAPTAPLVPTPPPVDDEVAILIALGLI